MKNKLQLLSFLCLGSLLALITSCTEPTQPESEMPTFTADPPTATVIAQVVEKAAGRASLLKMRALSPNTGNNPRYTCDMSNLSYDNTTQIATVPLKVTWSAKKAELSDTRKICELRGKLSVSFVNRTEGIISATYIPAQYNDWLKECLDFIGRTTDEALKPITFDPYK